MERIFPSRRGASIAFWIVVGFVVLFDVVVLPRFAAPFVAVVCCGVVAVWMWRRGAGMFQVDSRRARSLASRGLCPRCGYDLRGGGADAGGGEHCPECGQPIPTILRPPSYAWDRLKRP